MNLYKVSSKVDTFQGMQVYDRESFILAESKSKAVIKFLDIHPNFTRRLKCKLICKRDEIIPTVEPLKEKP